MACCFYLGTGAPLLEAAVFQKNGDSIVLLSPNQGFAGKIYLANEMSLTRNSELC